MAKKKRLALSISVIGLLLVLSVFGFIALRQQTALPIECTGGATYLITDANIISADQSTTGKEMVRVRAIVNGKGECARITFSPEQLNIGLKDDNAQATKTAIMDLVLLEETQRLPLQLSPGRIYSQIKDDDISLLPICTVSRCQQSNFLTTFNAEAGNFQCNCFFLEKYADAGSFAPIKEAQWKVSANVIGVGNKILTSSDSSANIGNKVIVKWTGNLVSNIGFNQPPGYDGVLRLDGRWFLVPDGTFELVDGRLVDAKDRMNRVVFGLDSKRAVAKEYNDVLFLNVDKNKLLEFASLNNDIVKSANIIGNDLVVQLSQPTIFPELIIDIDATLVQIVKTAGKPDVTCPSSSNSQSGQIADVTLTVKNVGSSQGNFALELLCNSVLQRLDKSSVSLGTTQQTNILGKITGTATENDISNTCKFTAYDVNNRNNQDSCTFTHTITVASCNEGQSICDNSANQLLTCQDGKFVAQNCKLGCEPSFEGGNAVCREIPVQEICTNNIDDDLDGKTDGDDEECQAPKECEPLLGFIPNLKPACIGVFGQIQLVIGAIVTLLAFITGIQILRRTLFKGKDKIMLFWAVLIALIIAGLIAYLLANKTFFYVGLGIGIIIIVARLFIGRVR